MPKRIHKHCPIHGLQSQIARLVTVCRVDPDLPDTWTAAWPCPITDCTAVVIDQPTRATAWILKCAGARFYDLPPMPAELTDQVRAIAGWLAVDDLLWLKIPGLDIVSAVERDLRDPL